MTGPDSRNPAGERYLADVVWRVKTPADARAALRAAELFAAHRAARQQLRTFKKYVSEKLVEARPGARGLVPVRVRGSAQSTCRRSWLRRAPALAGSRRLGLAVAPEVRLGEAGAGVPYARRLVGLRVCPGVQACQAARGSQHAC